MGLFCSEPFTCELIVKRHSLSCHYRWTITNTSHISDYSMANIYQCRGIHPPNSHDANLPLPSPSHPFNGSLGIYPQNILELKLPVGEFYSIFHVKINTFMNK